MEKDHFKNRTPDYCKYNSVNAGDVVYICEKSNQYFAESIKHLTKGTVIKKLTKHDHPRGIKLMIERTEKTPILGDTAVGRLVYIVKDGKVVTTDGLISECNIE